MTNHAAQLAIIKQVTRQESRSSAGNCQADDPTGITQLVCGICKKEAQFGSLGVAVRVCLTLSVEEAVLPGVGLPLVVG